MGEPLRVAMKNERALKVGCPLVAAWCLCLPSFFPLLSRLLFVRFHPFAELTSESAQVFIFSPQLSRKSRGVLPKSRGVFSENDERWLQRWAIRKKRIPFFVGKRGVFPQEKTMSVSSSRRKDGWSSTKGRKCKKEHLSVREMQNRGRRFYHLAHLY